MTHDARRLGVYAMLLLLVSAPNALRAQDPLRVRGSNSFGIAIDTCVRVPRARLSRLIALELGVAPKPPQDTGPRATQIRIRCLPKGRLLVRVDNPSTGRAVERRVDISNSPPNEQPRLIALAISELVETSSLAVPKTPAELAAARKQREAEARDAALRKRAREEADAKLAAQEAELAQRERDAANGPKRGGSAGPEGWSLGLTTGLRAAVEEARFAPGLSLAMVRGQDALSLGLDLELFFDGSQAPLRGEASMTLLSLGAGWAPSVRFASWTLRGWLGGRIGVVRLAGQPSDEGLDDGLVHWLPWGGPVLGGRLTFQPASWLQIPLGLELGYAALSAVAKDASQPVTGIEGLWLTTSLGLGLMW